MNVNKAMIAGRLTRDPELKALPSGVNVCSFSVATSFKYKKGEEWVEGTDYHNVVVWGAQAESCAKYLTKGSLVHVDGKLETRSWDKEGTKMYRTEIRAQQVEFGPRQNTEGQAQPDTRRPSEKAASAPAQPAQPAQPATGGHPNLPDYPDEEIGPDDIPF